MILNPFLEQQVADAGDITCNPFNINESVKQIQKAATDLLGKVGGIISMGGDHTIALPLLRAVNHKNKGPVALVHFDAHLRYMGYLFWCTIYSWHSFSAG